MKKINLLNTIKKISRAINDRNSKKNNKAISISRKYDFDYFDGDRKYGYGGYTYDGRWVSVAKRIKKIYKLKKNHKVLDIGCAKGFLIKDMLDIGLDAYGLDISNYAIKNSHKDVVGRIHLGSADKLPFPDNSFDFVISLNTLHNLEKKQCLVALKEIQRVTKKNSFIQVDSYGNKKEKKRFLDWVLTAKFHAYPKGWLSLFKQAKYKGDYYWTIV